MTCTPHNCPKCTHTSVRAPQRTRQTKASSSPQSEELRAASTLYSTLRIYRKLGPGNKEENVQKLCQAVSCVRTKGVGARGGSLPLAATVAAAIACNAGCGNSVSVIMDRFGATNQTSVCQIADRIRTQAWLWEGDAPLCADRTAERCTALHTRMHTYTYAYAYAHTGPRHPLRPPKRWMSGSSRRRPRQRHRPAQRWASYAGSGMNSSNLLLHHPRQSSTNRLSMTQMLPSQRRPAPCARSHRFLTLSGETTRAQT